MKKLLIIVFFSLSIVSSGQKDTVIITNVKYYQEGKVNVLVSPSGKKTVVTLVEGDWGTETRAKATLMTTKFGLVRIGKIHYLQIIFGKPRKDYVVPISKEQAGKFSKEYGLKINVWESLPENFVVL